MALAQLKPISRVYVWAHLADSSAVTSAFAAAPCKGEIKKMGSVIYNAITVANTLITTAVNGVVITGSNWTITQSGSAAGDVDFASPTVRSLAQVKENDTISWISDGGATTTCPTMFWAEIEMD